MINALHSIAFLAHQSGELHLNLGMETLVIIALMIVSMVAFRRKAQ